ncbi:MAG TPA: NAD-dependent epimerase/dehydratase family protein [Solirubrobacterales bacterium]|jgi:nucleoside-diphosphate-sugar epimerase|nr:NAD-dependent epimerase/dehydratase family protein [Solirubrobacterales bacterium]
MALTVAVTGPTGEIGGSLIDALEASEEVGAVRGMARRPFDPATAGWRKATYQRGDILDRGHLAELFDGADVAVHLAFAIFGDREETRRINLEGSRNVFEAAVEAGVGRLVYASSVAAYGFHPDNPQPLTEETAPLGSARFYYSAQKAELEEVLDQVLAGSELDAYVFRPCIVAGPRATMLIEQTVGAARLGDPAPLLRRHLLERIPLLRPVLPDAGVPLQLVHHDDVAAALAAAVEGKGRPGAYNLAGDGEIKIADIAEALGWRSVRVPRPALGVGTALAGRLSFISPQLEWATALTTPVIMDATKACRELGWTPRFDAAETLLQTAVSARETGLLD